MNKNKMIRTLGLFLLALLSIPAVHAQTAAANPWIFMAINAAVVAVVLFILQAFLVPGKADKEKVSVTLIVILASLLVAFLYGRQGYIWDSGPLSVFFSYHVLVNALIIGIVAYIVLGFTPIYGKLNSTEGKTGYGLIIFLIAMLFAVKLGNQWIWQQGVVAGLIGYLFGPEGILNPNPPAYRLWVFIGSAVLLTFFFRGFLLKEGVGKGNGDFISIALAIVMAASMAGQGASLYSVLQLGEIFFLIMLYQSLSKTFESKRWAFIFAVILVAWASAAVTAATPEYRGILGSMACGTPFIDCTPGETGILGTVFGWLGFGLVLSSLGLDGGIGFLVLAIIVIALLFLRKSKLFGESTENISTWGLVAVALLVALIFSPILLILGLIVLAFYMFGPEAAVDRSERRLGPLREGMRRIWINILNQMKETQLGGYIFGNFLDIRDPELPGELEMVFKDIRVDLYHLMNVMLRHEIYVAKLSNTHKLFDDVSKSEAVLSDRLPTIDSINDNMRKYIEGAKIVQLPDGSWDLEKKADEDQEDQEISKDLSIGFGKSYFVILKIMETYKRFLEKDLADPNRIGLDAHELPTQVSRLKEQSETLIKNMRGYYERYRSAVFRFRAGLRIKHQRLIFLDMFNMMGTRLRGHAFAKLHGRPEYYEYKLKKGTENGPVRKIDWSKVVRDDGKSNASQNVKNPEEVFFNFEGPEGHTHPPWLLEVNMYGFAVRDINDIQVNGKKLDYIRRFLKVDQTMLPKPTLDDNYTFPKNYKERVPRFHTVLESAVKEWESYLDDLSKGIYHPLSKEISEYENQIQTGHINLNKVRYVRILDRTRSIAYDREALKNPGLFAYWGRADYFDHDPGTLIKKPVNPYPMASMEGIYRFIKAISKKRVGKERSDRYLTDLKMGYKNLEDVPESEGSRGH